MQDLEMQKLRDNLDVMRIEANKPLLDDDGNQVGSWLPVSTPEPSWWTVESCDVNRCVPYAITSDGRFRPETRITPNEAIKYLTRSLNFILAQQKLNYYYCADSPVFCQHAQQASGYIGRITKMIKIIKQAQVEQIEQQWQTEKAIQVKLDEDYEIKVEKEEKARIAKRNKTLLLIGSLFLFG